MNIDKLKQRISKDRPMTMISLRVPKDVIDDLKTIAPLLGFSGYQPLIRAYIGQGLREDMERLSSETSWDTFIENLKKRGVDKEIISSAYEETMNKGQK